MKILLALLTALTLMASNDYARMKIAFEKGDINRAITYARTNAMRGDLNAMYDLGLLYYAKGDMKNAMVWLDRSVRNGGKGEMGVSLLLFSNSTNRDGYMKAQESLINAPKSELRDALMAVSKDLYANRRDATAKDYLLLGELFSTDKIIRPDMRTALFLINQAAKMGDPKALELMGDAYWRSSYTQGTMIVAPQTGNGVEIALEYYAQAVQKGNLDAMAKMGKLYIMAPWPVNNMRQGVRWILESANQGSALGAKMAAELYMQGQGVRPNRVLALKWYQKATSLCEVNQTLSQLYLRSGDQKSAKEYADAFKKCSDKEGEPQSYHLLFEPFE